MYTSRLAVDETFSILLKSSTFGLIYILCLLVMQVYCRYAVATIIVEHNKKSMIKYIFFLFVYAPLIFNSMPVIFIASQSYSLLNLLFVIRVLFHDNFGYSLLSLNESARRSNKALQFTISFIFLLFRRT